MTASHNRLWYFLFGIWIVTGTCNGYFGFTCKERKTLYPDAPSGVYDIVLDDHGLVFQVYCEMGLNGGGYTFLHPTALTKIRDLNIASIFTDKSSFLLRVLKTDGMQPYAVLSQIAEYSNTPLNISISSFPSKTTAPQNVKPIGAPYIFYQFLPPSIVTVAKLQGLNVNGVRVAYTLCGWNPASYFALFPNFQERSPATPYHPSPVYHGIFKNTRINPSRRLMPNDFFMFGEIHFGACGCLVQTDQLKDYGVVNIAMGFR